MKSLLAHWLIPKFSKWLLREPPLIPALLYSFDKIQTALKPGDVLLIEGRNRISRIIKQITHSSWSHSALHLGCLYDISDLYLRNKIKKHYQGSPEEPLLIESVMGYGTVVTPLSRYTDYNVRICRPRNIAAKDIHKVIKFAINHLGMRYSLRHILDLARFLFPWGILPRQWRSSLFVHNALKPTEEICSSLIAMAFQSVHFPIIPDIIQDQDGLTLITRNPRLYTPKDFDYSPFFDIIKHSLASIEEESFRKLTWKKDKTSGLEYAKLENVDIQIPLLAKNIEHKKSLELQPEEKKN